MTSSVATAAVADPAEGGGAFGVDLVNEDADLSNESLTRKKAKTEGTRERHDLSS